jgi:hypothetical protein
LSFRSCRRLAIADKGFGEVAVPNNEALVDSISEALYEKEFDLTQ